jgi:hypothetical protein
MYTHSLKGIYNEICRKKAVFIDLTEKAAPLHGADPILYRAGIFKQSMRPRNRAGKSLSYLPASLQRLA